VKSFNYFAARLPRHLLLEQFQLEAISEPVAFFRSQRKLLLTLRGEEVPQDADTDDLILSASGRPPGDEIQPPVEAPLSDAEPDMYPCILAICGSGNSFLRVSFASFLVPIFKCMTRQRVNTCQHYAFLWETIEFDHL
jgi:hypothetical protein